MEIQRPKFPFFVFFIYPPLIDFLCTYKLGQLGTSDGHATSSWLLDTCIYKGNY